jgi:hypothetical protein
MKASEQGCGRPRVGQRCSSAWTAVSASAGWQAEKEQAVAAACGELGIGLVSLNMPALLRQRLDQAAGAGVARFAAGRRADDQKTAGQDSGDAVVRRERRSGSGASAARPALPPFVDAYTCPWTCTQFDFPMPAFEERHDNWQAAGALDLEEAEQLAAMYRLGARDPLYRGDGPQHRKPGRQAQRDLNDLKSAARTQSQPRLTSLARR